MTRLFKRNWHSMKNEGGFTLEGKGYFISGFLIVGFIIISFVAFMPSYIHLFLTDDFKHLGYVEPFLDKPYTIYKVFNPYYLGWFYRPLQLVYFSFFRFLFGTNPEPYYIGMLLLHALNIVVIYKVARIWGNGRFGAICTAGLFAVIATHQGVVGWISAVSILLAATFSLISLYSLGAYLNNSKQIKYLVLTVLAAIIAVLCREELVILLPIILLAWLFANKRRPTKNETLIFSGFVLFGIIYIALTLLRPTWTPHADAALNLNLNSGITFKNLSQFLLFVAGSYLSLERVQYVYGWFASGLVLVTILLVGYAFWRGNRLLRLGILWVVALLIFLYVVVWFLSGDIAHRYLYLPWIGISLIVGAIIDSIYRKYPTKRIVSVVIITLIIGFLFSQTVISRQRQQTWHNDAIITADNLSKIKTIVPVVNKNTHFFAYNMPPVTDYIQAMAAISYDTKLDGRGGRWKRLLDFGSATPDDYLINDDNGVVSNIMPELQEHDEIYFVWQTDPIAEIIHSDGTNSTLDSGAYQLDQVVGPPGFPRFGFFIHPPSPEDGWASLTYTSTIPNNSDLMFDIYKNWGHIGEEDGVIFRVNVIDSNGNGKTIFQNSLDTATEDWIVHRVAMDAYWGETVMLQFQVNANGNLLHDHAYWANPRLVIDSID